ncbi:Spore cortex protein YabQ (Spore_YabQ) [Ruminococcus sp. YE71]|nr:Spore cortex protein YabQ (Spore_YabQ) [Ruminococcus sp. YE78]SFW22405.1 Spore cortex protein YabQ (Spore_YabQ) [Ruminococcus sp. YE71]
MTPMQLGTAAELEVLKNAVVTGVFLGAVYGVFAAVRRLLPNRAVGFVCDLLYSLAFGAVFFLFTLSQTDNYRWFVLLGMLVGAALWHASLGRLLVSAFCAAAKTVASPVIVAIDKSCRFMKGIFVKVHTNLQTRKKLPEST